MVCVRGVLRTPLLYMLGCNSRIQLSNQRDTRQARRGLDETRGKSQRWGKHELVVLRRFGRQRGGGGGCGGGDTTILILLATTAPD